MESSLLNAATDWQIGIDLDNNLVFPAATGVASGCRPGVVIWSPLTKTIIWGELTCPLEELILDAHIRKKNRYLHLEVECRVRGWAP